MSVIEVVSRNKTMFGCVHRIRFAFKWREQKKKTETKTNQLPFPITSFRLHTELRTSFISSTVLWARATDKRFQCSFRCSDQLKPEPCVINCLFKMAIGHDAHTYTHTETGSTNLRLQNIDNDAIQRSCQFYLLQFAIMLAINSTDGSARPSSDWLMIYRREENKKKNRKIKMTTIFSECIYLLFEWPCTFIALVPPTIRSHHSWIVLYDNFIWFIHLVTESVCRMNRRNVKSN